MSPAKTEKYARMANQIGDYFASQPAQEGAHGVADHVVKFWTPEMIDETLAALDAGDIALNATSAQGFAILRRGIAAAGR
jgi:formate dehydrogenase subunit delta